MITSSHNPKLKLVRDLLEHPKSRRQQEAFVVEGVRLAEEALQSGWKARLVLYSPEVSPRGQAVVEKFAAGGAAVESVEERLLRAVSDTEAPQGVLVVVESRLVELPPAPDFVLVADGIRDPGNLGTILRTAEAAGAQAVLLPPGNADAFAPKVVRAAMGAHFRLPVRTLEWAAIGAYLRSPSSRRPRIYIADAHGQCVHTQADFRAPTALIIGGEAAGAGQAAQQLADETVRIPMPGSAESLNAAIAAALLLFEVVRQRSL